MKKIYLLFLSFTCMYFANATNYPGNGKAGFGGTVGKGSLDVTVSGTDFTFTLNRGTGDMNDVLVIYIDGQSGGSISTANFTDQSSNLTTAISGYGGTGKRSTFNFASGFTPEYAIAFQPGKSLPGSATVVYLRDNENHTVSYTPVLSNNNTTTAATYSVTVPSIWIGLVSSFKFMATYISNTGYRADEAIGDPMTGFTQGWNTYTSTTAPLEFTGTLPVSFGALTAAHENKVTSISWNTETEINVSHFNVQKSNNGSDWKTIGTVDAKNISTGAKYHFVDNSSSLTLSYYRLQLVNLDGSSDYSSVVILRGSVIKQIDLLSNPARGTVNININSSEATTYRLELFSADGKLLASKLYQHSGSGAERAYINIPGAASGSMFLKISSATEKQTFHVMAY